MNKLNGGQFDMEAINKLENKVAGWLKSVPHLPVSAKKWIATNIWWLELIGVVLLGLSGITLLGTLSLYLGFTASIFGASVFNGFGALSTAISLLLMVASVVIMAIAIKPLKALKKKGWDFLFIALLIYCASFIVSAILSFGVISFIWGIISGAIGAAIGAYFLFEIRSYFVATK